MRSERQCALPLKLVPTFCGVVDGVHYTVVFLKLDEKDGALPGFTHRVIINREMVGYLSERFRPSGPSAMYFLERHREKKGKAIT